MDKLVLVLPKIEHEKDAQEYVNESIEKGSAINGTGGLHRYINNYKKWLEKIKNDSNKNNISNEKVPANTYFLVRKNDNKIIGMVNIRQKLNDSLLKKGGHIGYSIRPAERRKGYGNNILFLGIKKLKEMGINKILITCDKDNIGSAKTIQNDFGELENEILDEETGKIIQRYWIN